MTRFIVEFKTNHREIELVEPSPQSPFGKVLEMKYKILSIDGNNMFAPKEGVFNVGFILNEHPKRIEHIKSNLWVEVQKDIEKQLEKYFRGGL